MASEPQAQWSPVEPNSRHPFTIGSLNVIRSVCEPFPEHTHLTPNFVMWTGGIAGEGEDADIPVIFGQVVASTSSGGHMVGVTVAASCYPGQGYQFNPRDEVIADDFLEEWAPWAAHIIWDFATSQSRLIVSGLLDSTLSLPRTTPIPDLKFAQKHKRHDHQDNEETGSGSNTPDGSSSH